MYVCMYVCIYVSMYVCTYVRMHLCTYVCIYITSINYLTSKVQKGGLRSNPYKNGKIFSNKFF